MALVLVRKVVATRRAKGLVERVSWIRPKVGADKGGMGREEIVLGRGRGRGPGGLGVSVSLDLDLDLGLGGVVSQKGEVIALGLEAHVLMILLLFLLLLFLLLRAL